MPIKDSQKNNITVKNSQFKQTNRYICNIHFNK